MARILIGWELGASRGHAARIVALAHALRGEGHEVSLALQRLDALTPGAARDLPVWQAPVAPRLMVGVGRPAKGPPAGMADLLARAGMDDPGIVAAMIRGWRQLIDAIRPALVIAEFAPFLLLAARGRLPALAVGNGFTLPPAAMDSFPALIETAPGVDQSDLLQQINAGLADAEAAAITTLPQVFGAERSVPATFAELDPYPAERRETRALPQSIDFDAAAGDGAEIFVYAPERIEPDAPLWRGLGMAGLPVRVHVPRGGDALRDALTNLGIHFEPAPLPFTEIAQRSRLLVSHGAHDFVCAGLAAGLPQVVCHYDLEKLLCGLALARTGLGGHAPLGAIDPEAFSASLGQLYRDDGLADRAKAAAPGFRTRGQLPVSRSVIEAVATLS